MLGRFRSFIFAAIFLIAAVCTILAVPLETVFANATQSLNFITQFINTLKEKPIYHTPVLLLLELLLLLVELLLLLALLFLIEKKYCIFLRLGLKKPNNSLCLNTVIHIMREIVVIEDLPIDDKAISRYSIFFELINQKNVTLRDVKAFVTVLWGWEYGKRRVKIPLEIPDPSREKDMNPRESRIFSLFQFCDYNLGGSSFPPVYRGVRQSEFELYQHISGRNSSFPNPYVGIPDLNSGYTLEKPISNEICYIDVEVQAIDSIPTYARFALTAPDKIHVRLVYQGNTPPNEIYKNQWFYIKKPLRLFCNISGLTKKYFSL